jgi:hypothetical protein
MTRGNGGIIGPINDPTEDVASGVWPLEEQYQARLAGNWPNNAFIGQNSLRFDDGSSDNLTRTPSSAGNRTTWTWSAWIKRSNLSSVNILFSAGTSGTNDTTIYFNTSNQLEFFNRTSSSIDGYLITNRLFRDTSAWYHILAVWDTSNATAGDRMKLYVNGVEETSFLTDTNPALNLSSHINNNVAHYLGTDSGSGNYFDGYMSDVYFIDGKQLAPTNFGVTDSNGVWTPAATYTGDYGTNGFHLVFENASNLGQDFGPGGNNFTVNNLTSVDQSTDTPTNNYCTINPLDKDSNVVLADGNLTTSPPSANNKGFRSTFAVSQGKWYWEVKWNSGGGTAIIGIADDAYATSNYLGSTSKSWGYYNSGDYYNNASTNSYGNSFTSGDIIGVALDADNGYLYFSKNGTFQNSGDPTSGATGTGGIAVSSPRNGLWFPAGSHQTGTNVSHNFGSPPYSITSGNSDGAGYGNFEYAVPSGYYALNTKNLATYG